MIQANHPEFSCYSDMSLTIYAKRFSGPLMTTDTPSGTVLRETTICLLSNRDSNLDKLAVNLDLLTPTIVRV